jgi:hypothetical protein
MTSVSQQSQPPSQASNTSSASQSTPSYASTAKKAVSSPPIATGSSPSPAVAVGGSAPVQHHGKNSSVSPVNGRSSIPPAVPAVSGPAIAHGGSTHHSRKSSVTISANGTSGYLQNGGPVGGSKGGIQFGSITDSPAASHSTPQIAQSATSAPIPIPANPRVVSPAQSPSPIPQPSASGGRPPSGLAQQGNGVTFGSLGGDGDVSFGPLFQGDFSKLIDLLSVICDKHLYPKALLHQAISSLDTSVANPHNPPTATIRAQQGVAGFPHKADVDVEPSIPNSNHRLVATLLPATTSEMDRIKVVVAWLLFKAKTAQ